LIITRSPLRVTLGGGGTDLPSYYSRYKGYLISAAIDKYVYVGINGTFRPGIVLKYSELETVTSYTEIKHPIIRETLKLWGMGNAQMEITTLADIPSGTGLGSSSSFATALIAALAAHTRQPVSPRQIAEGACHVEIDVLKDPIGKQDQYIAAYGGITQFWFDVDGTVALEPLDIARETLWDLEDNLLLFFTGFNRNASHILKAQDDATKADDAGMIGGLHYVKELGFRSRDALLRGDLAQYGEILHEHWLHKRKRSPGMSNTKLARKTGLSAGNWWVPAAVDS
jgi:D-glycero-alpha-D-manno-heptose-7-phosphate kinase